MHDDVRNYVEELLTNEPCPIDTWIHLMSCPKCSRDLEALRKVSAMFHRNQFVVSQEDPLFYQRVQTRIAQMRIQSPWGVFLQRGLAKRLALACLACTGFLVYLWSTDPAESDVVTREGARSLFHAKTLDQQAQRDAVLANFVMDQTADAINQ